MKSIKNWVMFEILSHADRKCQLFRIVLLQNVTCAFAFSLGRKSVDLQVDFSVAKWTWNVSFFFTVVPMSQTISWVKSLFPVHRPAVCHLILLSEKKKVFCSDTLVHAVLSVCILCHLKNEWKNESLLNHHKY